MSVNYYDYIESDRWHDISDMFKSEAGNRCEICGATDEELHCHHKHYRTLGQERREDIAVLCSWCHHLYHMSARANHRDWHEWEWAVKVAERHGIKRRYLWENWQNPWELYEQGKALFAKVCNSDAGFDWPRFDHYRQFLSAYLRLGA